MSFSIPFVHFFHYYGLKPYLERTLQKKKKHLMSHLGLTSRKLSSEKKYDSIQLSFSIDLHSRVGSPRPSGGLCERVDLLSLHCIHRKLHTSFLFSLEVKFDQNVSQKQPRMLCFFLNFKWGGNVRCFSIISPNKV